MILLVTIICTLGLFDTNLCKQFGPIRPNILQTNLTINSILEKKIVKKFLQEHYHSLKQFQSKLGLTFFVQTVFKGYQKMTKVGASKVRVEQSE